VLSADHVGTETPEEGADEHPYVDSDGKAIGERRLELIPGVSGDDGLEEEDERIDGIAEKSSVCWRNKPGAICLNTVSRPTREQHDTGIANLKSLVEQHVTSPSCHQVVPLIRAFQYENV